MNEVENIGMLIVVISITLIGVALLLKFFGIQLDFLVFVGALSGTVGAFISLIGLCIDVKGIKKELE